jgi:hypothetical protein
MDAGWRPRAEGGMEFLIQIEPERFAELWNDQMVEGRFPPGLSDLRSYRIIVGRARLPQEPSAEQLEAAARRTAPLLTMPPMPSPTPTEPHKPARPTETAVTPSAPAAQPAPETPDRPWWPLAGSLVALFGSLGANAFLGWTTWDARRRYRQLVEDVHGPARD